MKRIWQVMKTRRRDVAEHPFFLWLNADTTPLEKRFVFSPVMIDFIMSFADMNKWFLAYAEPTNALERGINQHTEEDRTHSRFFQENWHTIDVGPTRDWRAGKTLWWLFDSRETLVVRQFGMDLLGFAVAHADPLIRFPIMEAIEICGDVFFANTAPIAQAWTDKHGVPHKYYGLFHRERETGHLHTDESLFLKAKLNDEQKEAASAAVNHVFDMFLRVLDQLVAYSQRALLDPEQLHQELNEEYQAALVQPAPRAPLASWVEPPEPPVAETQRALFERLEHRKEKLRRAPLLQWLRKEDGVRPIEKLRRFIALWGMDIVSYKDFNQLVLHYPMPRSRGEHLLNAWTDQLSRHSALYLQDWAALDMDRVLGWDMHEALAFYFLSPQTELHRSDMAKVKKLAFSNREPALRWWLLTALQSSSAPLLESTAPVAAAAEREHGLELNYWANRHHRVHIPGEVPHMRFCSEELTEQQQSIVVRMIDTVFDNMEGQCAQAHAHAVSGTFVNLPASLPLRTESHWAQAVR